MWCEIVGCVKPRPAVKLQMQMGAAAFQSEATIVRRVGSLRAFISSALLSAQAKLTRGRSQQTPLSLTLSPDGARGALLAATTIMLRYPSTIIDGLGELKTGARSRTPSDRDTRTQPGRSRCCRSIQQPAAAEWMVPTAAARVPMRPRISGS